MSELPAVPGVARIQLVFTLGAGLPITRIFMSYTGGPPAAADCLSYATTVREAFAGNLATLLDSTMTLSETKVTDMGSLSGAEASDTTVVDGTRPGDHNAASICVVVNHAINRRYRGGKPRSYYPFGRTDDMENERLWSPAFVTAVQTQYEAFITAISSETEGTTEFVAPVNVSYYSGFTNVSYGTPLKYRRTPTLRAAPVVDIITGSTVRGELGSQRRRLSM